MRVGTFLPLLHDFLYRRFNLDFRTCVSRVRFVFAVRVLFAPAAQRGLCPHALRAPLQGLLALDLGKGLTPPLASGVFVLQSTAFFICACGHITLSFCGFGGACFACETASAYPSRSDTFNSEFRIPNYSALPNYDFFFQSGIYSLTRSLTPTLSATLRDFSTCSSPMMSTTVSITSGTYLFTSDANLSIAS